MAHCPIEKLADIEKLLQEIRTLERIQEKSKGIFYLKSKGFLHFHLKDEQRWADVRDGAEWGSQIDLPFHPNKKTQENFLLEIKKRHKKTLKL